MKYTLGRYGSLWSVFDSVSNCHLFFGSKKKMEAIIARLNDTKEPTK